MLEALVGFADNHTELTKDAGAAAAIAELDRIYVNKNPYSQVNKIEGLLATVEKVNETLAEECRTRAIATIDNKITEATYALDSVQAEAGLRNSVLKPLQDLKLQLAGLSSIPRILFLQARSGDLLDEVMDKLAQAEKAKMPPVNSTQPDTSGKTDLVPPPPLAPKSRPIKVIRVAELRGKSYLESEDEVDDYLQKLKASLMEVIRSGHKARLQ
jgi:hypothetical protein